MLAIKDSMVPLVAVGFGVAGAAFWYALGDAGSQASAPTAERALGHIFRAVPAAPASIESAVALEGKVLEVIDVPKYTYLRIEDGGGVARWVAVATSAVEIGQVVSLQDATEMTDFESAALGRTFDRIWFGTLETGAVGSEPTTHRAGGAPQGSTLGSPVGPGGSPGVLPEHHRMPLVGGDEVPVGEVAPATGPLGRRISDVYANRIELSGKKVRVRGVVVKSVAGVLGQTFVHLRDGSGDAATATHDLTVTTEVEPRVGELVLFEGTLALDKDFGSGFTYPVLLQSAQTVSD